MRFCRSARDDRGQATVEYILLLAIAVAMAVVVARKLIAPIMAKLADYASKLLQNSIFGKADMHHLNVGGH